MSSWSCKSFNKSYGITCTIAPKILVGLGWIRRSLHKFTCSIPTIQSWLITSVSTVNFAITYREHWYTTSRYITLVFLNATCFMSCKEVTINKFLFLWGHFILMSCFFMSLYCKFIYYIDTHEILRFSSKVKTSISLRKWKTFISPQSKISLSVRG